MERKNRTRLPTQGKALAAPRQTDEQDVFMDASGVLSDLKRRIPTSLAHHRFFDRAEMTQVAAWTLNKEGRP